MNATLLHFQYLIFPLPYLANFSNLAFSTRLYRWLGLMPSRQALSLPTDFLHRNYCRLNKNASSLMSFFSQNGHLLVNVQLPNLWQFVTKWGFSSLLRIQFQFDSYLIFFYNSRFFKQFWNFFYEMLGFHTQFYVLIYTINV